MQLVREKFGKGAEKNKEVHIMQRRIKVAKRSWPKQLRTASVWALAICLTIGMANLVASFAKAAPSVEVSEPATLITEMYYDATDVNSEKATPFVQDNASEALNNSTGVTKPTLPTDIKTNTALIDAVKQKDKLSTDPTLTEVNWSDESFGEGPVLNPYGTPGSVTITGSEFTPVQVNGDSWTFGVKSSATAKGSHEVTVAIQGGCFSCKYTRSSETVTCEVFVGSLRLTEPSLKATYTVELKDTAQTQDEKNIKEALPETLSPIYDTQANLFTDVLKVQKGDWSLTTNDSNYAKDLGLTLLNKDDKTLTLTIKPSAMQATQKALTLTFKSSEEASSPSFSKSVDFPATEKKPVKFIYGQNLDCRPEEEQKTFFASQLNKPDSWKSEEGKDAFRESDIPSGGEICTGVSLEYPTELPEDPTSSSFQATVSYALVDTLSDKYKIDTTTMQSTINVNPAESIDVTRLSSLSLVNDDNDSIPLNDPENVKWVNWKHAYTKMDDYSIIGNKTSNKTTGSTAVIWNDVNAYYSDGAPMNDAQGEYTGQTIFVKDNKGLIKKVTNITYRIDRTAPTIENFSVNKDTLVSDESWVDWIFNNRGAAVTITAVDEDKEVDEGGLSLSNDLPQRKVSGLSDNVENDKVVYVDKHSGETKDIYGFKTDESGTAGKFQFDIDGDQQADVDSFKAYVTDNAGNTNDGDLSGAKEIPAYVIDLAIDSGNPELQVFYDNNDVHHGSYYNKSRTATFVVTMPTFEFLQKYRGDRPVITICEGDKNAGYGNCIQFTANDFRERPDLGQDKWAATFTFSDDADYKVLGTVTSLAGYSASIPDEAFTIDKTPPVLTVDFDNNNVKNGKYYNAERTATVSIAERNFDPSLIKLKVDRMDTNGTPAGPVEVSDWSNNGNMHTATVSFPQDGTYQIKQIAGSDLADNAMATYGGSEFVIDKEKPTINLSVNGDADASAHAYKDGASLAVSLDDTNIDPSSTIEVVPVGLNSKANPYASSPAVSPTHINYDAPSPAVAPENDNLYRVTIHAVDLAGNEDTKTCEWSVNRFGSVYTVNQETKDMLDKQYIKSDDATDATIIEINPSGIDQSSAKVNISNGADNNDLQNGSGFQLNAAKWDNLPAYYYVIPKAEYANDGTYQITVQSHDLAGNASSNTMNDKNLSRTNTQSVIFAIDNTAPVVSFSGFNEYEVPEATHDVTVKAEDNIALDRAVVKMSDGSEMTLSADDFDATTHNATITLHESNAPQQIEVQAYDKAGNMTPEFSPNIIVSTNPFVLWANNPVVVAVTLVAAVCGIGAAVHFARLKKTSADKK